jgi:hypothetical protein
MLCDRCWDGQHQLCERGACNCVHLDPQPPKRRRPRHDIDVELLK